MRRSSLDADAIVALIAERSAHWTDKGFVGPKLYERLASDSEIPENLGGRVIAALENKQPSAVAQERKQGRGSAYLRLASNYVVYPRASYFLHLRDRFVERRPALAQHEYTTTT